MLRVRLPPLPFVLLLLLASCWRSRRESPLPLVGGVVEAVVVVVVTVVVLCWG